MVASLMGSTMGFPMASIVALDVLHHKLKSGLYLVSVFVASTVGSVVGSIMGFIMASTVPLWRPL